MSCKKNYGQMNIQDLILTGFKSPTREDTKCNEQLNVPRTITKYSRLHAEEASMNKYMLRLKCLLKNLSMLEEGMVYMGKMKPIVFGSIYVLVQMQAKLYKFRNRLGHLPIEYRKLAHSLIGKAYDSIIDHCFKGAQNEKCLKKIVTDVAYIDEVIMKHAENNHENGIISCQTDIYPLLSINNKRHVTKLPLKKINKNNFKFKLMSSNKQTKPKKKKCDRESSFLIKIEEIRKKDKKRSCRTADKIVSVSIETDSVAMQFDPNLSGPMCVPKYYSENKIRSPWLANIKKCSCRATIEEELPPENNFQYEVSMRHAATNILSNKNTKETQTTILGISSGDYEYSLIDMTYTKEKKVNEKTKEEMITNLRNKQVFILSETDIFETMPRDESGVQQESDSSTCTVVEDSDCNIKISNVESKPYYKKYKMLYNPNKNSRNRPSKRQNQSVLIKKDTIEHKDEILAYIKELGSILLNSDKLLTSGISDTDTNT